MKILFSGGGTLGPVTPLLAVWDVLQEHVPTVEGYWVGTATGPERTLVERASLPFTPLPSAKFSRHAPWTIPWNICIFMVSLVKAWRLMRSLRPSAVLSAGAYVSVPLALVAWLQGVPVHIHQLDVTPGLANRLMAPLARRITTTWPQSLGVFSAKKSRVIGGMVRGVVLLGDPAVGKRRFLGVAGQPYIFVTGGGTGAVSLNVAVAAIIPELTTFATIIHLTGKGKMTPEIQTLAHHYTNYYPCEFLGEGLADALAVADVVVARAGMGTMCELVAMGKPTIFIPLPNSHQGANAQAAVQGGGAMLVNPLTPQTLLQAVQKILHNDELRADMSKRMQTLFPLSAASDIAQDLTNYHQ